jgi:hypothetical protein
MAIGPPKYSGANHMTIVPEQVQGRGKEAIPPNGRPIAAEVGVGNSRNELARNIEIIGFIKFLIN